MESQAKRRLHVENCINTVAGMDVERSLESVTNLMKYRQEIARKLLQVRNNEDHRKYDKAYTDVEIDIKRALSII